MDPLGKSLHRQPTVHGPWRACTCELDGFHFLFPGWASSMRLSSSLCGLLVWPLLVHGNHSLLGFATFPHLPPPRDPTGLAWADTSGTHSLAQAKKNVASTEKVQVEELELDSSCGKRNRRNRGEFNRQWRTSVMSYFWNLKDLRFLNIKIQ